MYCFSLFIVETGKNGEDCVFTSFCNFSTLVMWSIIRIDILKSRKERVMEKIENTDFEDERALYGLKDTCISRCVFDGPADGESALKESRNILVEECDFHLRYPLWHVVKARIENSTMTESCRAALWYDNEFELKQCIIEGTKAVRECRNIVIDGCLIRSQEFGWFSRDINISNSRIESVYPFLRTHDLRLSEVTMNGKYSFQYVENAKIRDSNLDTKDAFWHSRNVTVYDSVIKGEYLGWYSENLKLIRCRIIGTQPLCYARGLVLEDCEMVGSDLAFEHSDVNASVKGQITSVKNPAGGRILADGYGEIIVDERRLDEPCRIEVREKEESGICCCR